MEQLESDQLTVEEVRAKNAEAVDRYAEVESLAEAAVDKAMRRRFTITKFERHADGHWHARITGQDGRPVYVHARYGCWLAPVRVKNKPSITHKELVPEAHEALVARQRQLERAERREVKDGAPEDRGGREQAGPADDSAATG